MPDQVSLYYHEDGFEDRKLLGYAASHGVPLKVIDVRKVPPTPTQWLDYAYRLNVPIEALVNKEHKEMPAPANARLSEEEWAELLHKSPQLLSHPIAERNGKVALIKTSSDLLRL